jgi:hypothetical protein
LADFLGGHQDGELGAVGGYDVSLPIRDLPPWGDYGGAKDPGANENLSEVLSFDDLEVVKA